MRRKSALFLSIIVILTLVGCKKRMDSSTCLTEKFFYTLEECAAYLAGMEGADSILSADKKTATIYQPAEIPEGFQLDRIRLSGGYVTYYYTADGYTRPEHTVEAQAAADSAQEDITSPSSAEPTITPAEEQNQIQKEINELGREGYIKKYGLSEMDLKEIEYRSNTFLVQWSFGSTDGKALLQDSIEKLTLSEYPDMPGYYGYEVTYPGVDEVLAYRVFWADGKYCFSATVPASIMDEMCVSGQVRKTGGFLLGAEKKTFSTQELKLEKK